MPLQAFQLIDRGPFHRLLKYLCPSLTEKDILHQNTLCKEILNRSKLVEARVKEELRVCFICLKWTAYLVVLLHRILKGLFPSPSTLGRQRLVIPPFRSLDII